MTRLELISSGVVDMYDTLPISLNYSIADIREPDKRKASFSKTITIPATKNNNKLFKHIYEIDSYSDFNPKVKADCVLYQDDLAVISGFMRLVNILVDGDKIEYEVNLIGDNGGFFQAITGELLEDIDLSDLDHVLNLTNVTAAWNINPTFGEGFMYPVVENGYQDGIDWDITTMQPAVYVKRYIDEIFSNAGYTYESTFFDSDRFKRLIIPYSSGQSKMDENTVSNRNVEVSNTTTHNVQAGGNLAAISFDTVDSDNGSLFENPGLRAKRATTYRVSFEADITYVGGIGTFFTVQVFNPSGYSWIAYTHPDENPTSVSFVTPEFEVVEGAFVLIAANKFPGVSSATLGAGYNAKLLASNKGIAAGDTVVVNNTIPRDIKQLDFFMSIIKMFNLYVSLDKSISNKLLIETRAEYYGSDFIDWSDKRDNNSELSIKPLGDLTARRYIYEYKEDKDYYNTDYQTKYEESYGTKTWNTDNEFLQNDDVTKVIFSPTIMVGDRSTVLLGTRFPFLYPSISSGSFKEVTGKGITANIRILYFGGISVCTGLLNLIVDEVSIPQDRYGYVGMLDSPINPTFDLSFGVPKKVYYDTTVYTNGNLFNLYHKGFIEELTNKDSKVVTGKFNLTAADISILDFRKVYVVDGHHLRLNKVVNYDPAIQGLTEVEFILIKDSTTFSATQGTTNGGVNIQF
jgi:hypothetical protein